MARDDQPRQDGRLYGNVFSDDVRRSIRTLRGLGLSVRQVAARVEAEHGVRVSIATVSRVARGVQ